MLTPAELPLIKVVKKQHMANPLSLQRKRTKDINFDIRSSQRKQ